jgi:hypothetical protein
MAKILVHGWALHLGRCEFAMLALSENVFRCAKIKGVLCLTKC